MLTYFFLSGLVVGVLFGSWGLTMYQYSNVEEYDVVHEIICNVERDVKVVKDVGCQTENFEPNYFD